MDVQHAIQVKTRWRHLVFSQYSQSQQTCLRTIRAVCKPPIRPIFLTPDFKSVRLKPSMTAQSRVPTTDEVEAGQSPPVARNARARPPLCLAESRAARSASTTADVCKRVPADVIGLSRTRMAGAMQFAVAPWGVQRCKIITLSFGCALCWRDLDAGEPGVFVTPIQSR
ncbi:hypothetical protein IQ07DRAFT_209041 [Pyrenochaeta sp. DS3sAY3a]|nr:hypothetical protein IQ07DRAFT_209041 [Pyrenochaeta sp. DS3sAY3a]